jgi:hypothetical protein
MTGSVLDSVDDLGVDGVHQPVEHTWRAAA